LVLCFFLVSALSITTKPLQNNQDEPIFQSWMAEHKRAYPTQDEYNRRLGIFSDNIQRIHKLNRDSQTYGGATFNLTKFSDYTPEEFKVLFLNALLINETPDEEKELIDLPGGVVGDTFDWKGQGKVTAVKNQAQCGSCWAFSATENIESVWMIAKGITSAQMKPLAPQQIVDCDKSDGGCNGGWPATAYKYVVSAGGLEPESAYPYKAKNQQCSFNKASVYTTISGYKYVTRNKDESQMKTAVATVAPISICVDAQPWQSYSKGILTARQCGTSLDHCVQITGYDTTSSTPFWTVRNSWGTNWGESGYIRLEYGKNTCGLSQEATTATP